MERRLPVWAEYVHTGDNPLDVPNLTSPPLTSSPPTWIWTRQFFRCGSCNTMLIGENRQSPCDSRACTALVSKHTTDHHTCRHYQCTPPTFRKKYSECDFFLAYWVAVSAKRLVRPESAKYRELQSSFVQEQMLAVQKQFCR